MTNTATCKSCSHFDINHEMCLAATIPTAIGPTFATRTSETPACWSEYDRKIVPGKITTLFETNRITTTAKNRF